MDTRKKLIPKPKGYTNRQRNALRALFWHHGIYKEVDQDALIDSLFYIGYRKINGEPPTPIITKGRRHYGFPADASQRRM